MRLHGQDGIHDRAVINKGRHNADQNIGDGGIKIGVEGIRSQREIANIAEAADTHHDPIKKEEGVPLEARNIVKDIEEVSVFLWIFKIQCPLILHHQGFSL